MTREIKVGDKVRLTGADWALEYQYPGLGVGSIVEVDDVDSYGSIWAGDAGTVGREGRLYGPDNPEPSGDYACELVEDVGQDKPEYDGVHFSMQVRDVLSDIEGTLISKNQAYGDAALNPIRAFSKASSIEQLKVRIDDKISRIQRGTDFEDEDTVRDLIGYLVLLVIARESTDDESR